MRLAHPFREDLPPEIEFVVPCNHDVEMHCVHKLYDGSTLKLVRPIAPLDHIARSDEERGLLAAARLRQSGKVRRTSQDFIAAVRLVALGEAVEVVDVEDSDISLFRIGGLRENKKKEDGADECFRNPEHGTSFHVFPRRDDERDSSTAKGV